MGRGELAASEAGVPEHTLGRELQLERLMREWPPTHREMPSMILEAGRAAGLPDLPMELLERAVFEVPPEDWLAGCPEVEIELSGGGDRHAWWMIRLLGLVERGFGCNVPGGGEEGVLRFSFAPLMERLGDVRGLYALRQRELALLEELEDIEAMRRRRVARMSASVPGPGF